MYAGKIMEFGSIKSLIDRPIHPYMQAVIDYIPRLSQPCEKRINSIYGNLPDLINLPSGCIFHPRCPYAKEVCSKTEPTTKEGETPLCFLTFASAMV